MFAKNIGGIVLGDALSALYTLKGDIQNKSYEYINK